MVWEKLEISFLEYNLESCFVTFHNKIGPFWNVQKRKNRLKSSKKFVRIEVLATSQILINTQGRIFHDKMRNETVFRVDLGFELIFSQFSEKSQASHLQFKCQSKANVNLYSNSNINVKLLLMNMPLNFLEKFYLMNFSVK